MAMPDSMEANMGHGMIALKVEFLPPSGDEQRECWVASCPEIDLVTQGDTFEDAEKNLRDAIDGWFGTCLEMGTLDAALKECGFSPCRIEKIKSFVPAALLSQQKRRVCHA